MRFVVGGVLLFQIGCALLSGPCREVNNYSPLGPPEAVERWWNDYLDHASPKFAALLVEGSEALRREGKGGEWSHFFVGYGNGTGPIWNCTRLNLPMPEACAARQRERVAHVPLGDLVPDDRNVTGFHSDEAATKVWLEAACKLGYREKKE